LVVTVGLAVKVGVVVIPSDQRYVLAPAAVNVPLVPKQTVVGVMVTIGAGFMVTALVVTGDTQDPLAT
jgi:hypothetical protein